MKNVISDIMWNKVKKNLYKYNSIEKMKIMLNTSFSVTHIRIRMELKILSWKPQFSNWFLNGSVPFAKSHTLVS